MNTLIATLGKQYPEWTHFFQVRYEDSLAVIVIDQEQILVACFRSSA